MEKNAASILGKHLTAISGKFTIQFSAILVDKVTDVLNLLPRICSAMRRYNISVVNRYLA